MSQAQAEHLDREISWLQFNSRVLSEASDSRNPLLARVAFHCIFSSNLDEFFMKRVGGLKRQALAQLTPPSTVSAIREALLPMIERHAASFQERLRPELKAQGIELLGWKDLTESEVAYAREYFISNVYPVLTPLAVDPGHPFPYLSNLSSSWGVLLRHPDRPEEELFARIKIPDVFPFWIRLPSKDDSDRFLSIHEMIENNLGELFPGLEVVYRMLFRITRNADLERDEEDAEDLLEMVAQEIRQRKFAPVVRLEHGPEPHPKILALLIDELELTPEDVYELPMFLEYYSLKPLLDLNRANLKFPPWIPAVPNQLQDPTGDIFSVLRETDLLVHHPFESFTASVERFIRQSAEDPKVLAIKMTLYRIGEESPFVPLLIRAAESGKQVVCLVELKARFDEEKNILIAQALEKAGVHVVYGIVGLKTHSKVALIVRREQNSVRSYAHIGTGNYHSQTSRLYTDFGLFTAKPEFVQDVVHLFHYLTGRSEFRDFTRLWVAPIGLKERFLERIAGEAARAKDGKPARIIAKMNGLDDREICSALYQAAQAGVNIDLIVRGICILRPGIPGLSENIRVRSVIGRFLEHSRVFYFSAGAEDPIDGEFYIGSCDWMQRNLNLRVEAVVPLVDRHLKERCWETLDLLLRDERQSWALSPDGSYRRISEHCETPGVHELLMTLATQRSAYSGLPSPVQIALRPDLKAHFYRENRWPANDRVHRTDGASTLGSQAEPNT